MNLYTLPDIVFAEKDPQTIKNAVIAGYEAAYEAATGEKITLYPGDPRRLFLLSVADIIILQRNVIDYTGKMNLLAYAAGNFLDHLGLLLGVTRLAAKYATTEIRFTLSAAQPTPTVIPAGIRVTPGDGNVYFETVVDLEIPAGELSGVVGARSLAAGAFANGFMPGQINRLVDPLVWVQSVSNTTESSGGADIEGDESLRDRIHLAPESFSVAGPKGAYEFWAKTAHQDIVDVKVVGPEDDPPTQPGHVEIYPLLKGGELPTQDILDLVDATLNREDVRPDTDFVHVLTPEAVPFALSVTYWIDRRNASQEPSIKLAVEAAVGDWLLWQRSALGRDLNPSELNRLMVNAGAKRTEISLPAFAVMNYKQIAAVDPDNREVLYGGLEDG